MAASRPPPFVADGPVLTDGPGGPRLELRGVNVWGVPDTITNDVQVGGQSFWAQQHQARGQVVAQAKVWGANLVRLRVLADDYNNAPSANTDQRTKAQIIQVVREWRDAAAAQGMYLLVTTWDGLDGAFSDAGWAGNGWRVHQFFTDVHAALGDDPRVIYEVTNEPNGVTLAQWDANMRASILHFRETIGYQGLLVIDPVWWANSGPSGNGYSEPHFDGLEAYDAARAGMGGHQLAFAKHDYAQNYPGKVWSAAGWQTAVGDPSHLVFETEFGNYNGSAATVDDTWSQQAAQFFAGRFDDQQSYVGAAAFLWGPWSDANALTGADNATPTSPWGVTVRDLFLAGS